MFDNLVRVFHTHKTNTIIQPDRMSLNLLSVCLSAAFLFLTIFLSPSPHAAIAGELTQSSPNGEISRIEQNDVIYLGENHACLAHHQQQLAIITQLYRRSHSQALAIALEMFQRPFQPILNRYLAGKIDEDQLREQTEYEARWGFDWEFYAPILRFAKINQIPLIALNTPAEVTFKVAELGIDGLQNSDFRYIPPLSEIELDNQTYRQKIIEIYQQHVENGEGNSSDADNFFAAQVLWDETMASAIAQYYQTHPRSQIAVLVGQAHIMYDYAIPDRVARRIDAPSFTQQSLFLEECE